MPIGLTGTALSTAFTLVKQGQRFQNLKAQGRQLLNRYKAKAQEGAKKLVQNFGKEGLKLEGAGYDVRLGNQTGGAFSPDTTAGKRNLTYAGIALLALMFLRK